VDLRVCLGRIEWKSRYMTQKESVKLEYKNGRSWLKYDLEFRAG